MLDTVVFNKSLAREIRLARNWARKSQLLVQEETGVNIGRIEMGRGSVTITTLLILCQYFDIPMLEILKRAEMSVEDPKGPVPVHLSAGLQHCHLPVKNTARCFYKLFSLID